MEFRGQSNHAVNVMTLSDRLPQVSSHRFRIRESAFSWNKYNHNYSREQQGGQSRVKTNFYEDEYEKMVSRMDKMVMSTKKQKTVDPFGELLQLSVLADGGDLGYVDSNNHIPPQQMKKKSRLSIHCLLKLKRQQDEKHEMFMAMMRNLEEMDKEYYRRKMKQRKEYTSRMPPAEFLMDSTPKETDGNFRMSSTSEGDSSMGSMPDGDFMRSIGPDEDLRTGSIQAEDIMIGSVSGQQYSDTDVKNVTPRKMPKTTAKKDKVAACRHFSKGWCRQGKACSFLHSLEDSHPDSQKVFLGGLPHPITPAKLVQELGLQGFRVINEPKIFRGFSPQICLASNVEANKMLEEGRITICGSKVEVRPYKAITKKERDRQLDTNRRSVFLGGLPSAVTVQMLKTSIDKLGMKMTNRPLIKAGFIPKVTLASAEQAQNLVARGTLNINGATVSVRTYECKNQPR